MGVVEDVRVDGSHVDVDLVLTTGWCPFVASMSSTIPDALRRSTASRPSTCKVVWDPVWTMDRLSESARAKLAMPLEQLEPYRVAKERRLMAITETAAEHRARKRKVDAFVFDCVCHIFNFDQANALGPPGRAVRRAPLRVPPAAHPRGRDACSRARSSCSEWTRRRDLRDGHRGLRHRHDRGPAAAADRPLPRRPVAVGEVRRDGRQASRTARSSGAR